MHKWLTALLALGLIYAAGCKDDKKADKGPKALPEDRCERIAVCGIDKSCGGSLFGEDVHGKCGEEATCEKVVQCVSDTFRAHLANKATEAELAVPLQMCGSAVNYGGALSGDKGIKAACTTAFAQMEQHAQNAQEKSMTCLALSRAGKMGEEFAARAKKVCPEE